MERAPDDGARRPRALVGARDGLAAAAAIARAAAGGRVPLKVAFHVTYRCNLTCGYCGRRDAESPELPPHAVTALLERYAAAGTRFWSWNGGEPLLRPDIEAHVAHAARLGMRQILVSNCTLLARRPTVLDHLQLLEVSLDGRPAVHDAVRGRGSFAAVEAGLARAADRGVAAQLLVVLTRTSAPELPWLLAFARDHGAGLAVQPVAPHREGPARPLDDEWALPPRELREAVRWLDGERARGGVGSSHDYLSLLAGDRPAPRCWAGRLFLNLRPDGSEALCCARLHEPSAPAVEGAPLLPDASRCTDCVNAGPQETNLCLTPRGLGRAAFGLIGRRLPWS